MRRVFRHMAIVVSACLGWARIATAILQEIRALVLANRGLHQPLTMFFAPLTVDLATKEYNDLVAQVAPQIPKIRAFSYFDANGRLEVPG